MKTVNFTHKRATTFEEVQIQIKTNGTPDDLTGATILMQLRKEEKGLVAFTPDLTIFDPTNGWFRIDKQIINIPSCIYYYDIQITYANGEVFTYISGLFAIDKIISEAV